MTDPKISFFSVKILCFVCLTCCFFIGRGKLCQYASAAPVSADTAKVSDFSVLSWRDSLFIYSPLFQAYQKHYNGAGFSFDNNGISGKIEADFNLKNRRGTFTPLSKLFSSVKKVFGSKEPELDTLPSVTQMRVFTTIWRSDSATSVDIYSRLPAASSVTAEELNHVLDRMTNRNLLDRKLVSPQNKVFLGAMGIGVGVEVDPENRRNRVYQYKSNLSEKDMQRFLSRRIVTASDSVEQARVRELQAILFQLRK
ncbi:MAG: hypothetical protein U5R06_20075 [candidate division KSB1 bacterium]|nr:hypothetical protein [candidate division KSB1 bacterium]